MSRLVSFGTAELMLNMHGKAGAHDVSLWFYTDQIDNLYRLLMSRQLDAAPSRRYRLTSAGGGA